MNGMIQLKLALLLAVFVSVPVTLMGQEFRMETTIYAAMKRNRSPRT